MIGCIDCNSNLPDLLQFSIVSLSICKALQIWIEQLPFDSIDGKIHPCKIWEIILPSKMLVYWVSRID